MQPIIAHIELVVRDLDVSERFYDRLLPLLGYDLADKSRMGAKIEGAQRATKRKGPVTPALPQKAASQIEAASRSQTAKPDVNNAAEPLAVRGGEPGKTSAPMESELSAPDFVEYRHPLLTLRLRRAPGAPGPVRPGGAVRLSLRTQKLSEVDGLCHTVRRMGGDIVHAPFVFWDGDDAYRAFQFHDPDGILWEILHELDETDD